MVTMAGSTPTMYITNNIHFERILDMKKSELTRTLNWLLSLQLITVDEYNAILLNSLPYLKK